MNKYTRIRKIGRGNFGDVWLVEDAKGKVSHNQSVVSNML